MANAPMAERRLAGRCAAPGLVAGTVWVSEPVREGVVPTGSPEEERAGLLKAIDRARSETVGRAARATGDAADMLAFQVAMLSDDELTRPALEAITSGASAAGAFVASMNAEAACYTGSGNTVLAARAADLGDIRDRVLAYLAPESSSGAPPPGCIIAASDLSLTGFLDADWSAGGGIVLTGGSEASHVAMLARARGVPMVVAIGGSLSDLAGRHAIVDATAGELLLDPGDEALRRFEAETGRSCALRGRADEFRAVPALTVDGTRVTVSINIGDLRELDGLDPRSCDGVGLVRTEILFHPAAGSDDEDAQYAAYGKLLAWADGRPVTVRTLDAGGDKPMPGITPTGEGSSFLGLRGIRLSLQQPTVFMTQLRALVRAAVHGKLRVMLPMVTVPAELDIARTMLDAAIGQLAREGIPFGNPLLGIMVEVPAAAVCIDRFDAGFYSIGSNDLTQYVTAAGRDIGSVSYLADPLNPAILKLVGAVSMHGRTTGREVSLCGDAAADPRCIGPLLRAGLRSLSVPPNALGPVKQAIAAIDLASGAT